MGMRSDSPRVAAASEARRSSSLSTSSKRVSLEAETAYDSPNLLPLQSLVFPPNRHGQPEVTKNEHTDEEEGNSYYSSTPGKS